MAPPAPSSALRDLQQRGFWGAWTGRLFLAGLLVTGAWLAFLFAVYAWDQHIGVQLLQIAGLYFVAGREAAVFAGLDSPPAPDPLLILAVTAGHDIIAVFLFLPLVVLGIRSSRSVPVVRWALHRFERAVDRHRDRAERGGAIGLAIFSFTPALGSSPLIGSTVGVTARLRPTTVIVAVLSGSLLADVVWSFFAYGVHELLAPFRLVLSLLPWAVIALLAVLAGLGALRRRGQHDPFMFASRLPGMSHEQAQRLREAGVKYVDDLLAVHPAPLATEVGVTLDRVAEWQSMAELMHGFALNAREAAAFVHCGVRRQEDLVGADATVLATKLNACEETKRLLKGREVSRDEVERVVRAAARHLDVEP